MTLLDGNAVYIFRLTDECPVFVIGSKPVFDTGGTGSFPVGAAIR